MILANPEKIAHEEGLDLKSVMSILLNLEKTGLIKSILITQCPNCKRTTKLSDVLGELPGDNLSVCNYCGTDFECLENTYYAFRSGTW